MNVDRIAKLRRMAEHPTSNPHEAAIAREEIARLGAAEKHIAAKVPMTARARIDGAWFIVAVPIEHFDFAKAVMLDALGSAGSIAGELAMYRPTADEECEAWLVSALRGNGFAVEVAVVMPLAGCMDEWRNGR